MSVIALPRLDRGIDRSRACPTSALNCRNRKHPISMRSSNHRTAFEAPSQGWRLLDAPLEAGHDTPSIHLILRVLSGDDALNHPAAGVRQAEIAALIVERQLLVVDAQQIKHR